MLGNTNKRNKCSYMYKLKYIFSIKLSNFVVHNLPVTIFILGFTSTAKENILLKEKKCFLE